MTREYQHVDPKKAREFLRLMNTETNLVVWEYLASRDPEPVPFEDLVKKERNTREQNPTTSENTCAPSWTGSRVSGSYPESETANTIYSLPRAGGLPGSSKNSNTSNSQESTNTKNQKQDFKFLWTPYFFVYVTLQ